MLHHNQYEILGCLRLVETNNAHFQLLVILSSKILTDILVAWKF